MTQTSDSNRPFMASHCDKTLSVHASKVDTALKPMPESQGQTDFFIDVYSTHDGGEVGMYINRHGEMIYLDMLPDGRLRVINPPRRLQRIMGRQIIPCFIELNEYKRRQPLYGTRWRPHHA